MSHHRRPVDSSPHQDRRRNLGSQPQLDEHLRKKLEAANAEKQELDKMEEQLDSYIERLE